MPYDLSGLPDTFLTPVELQYLLDTVAVQKPRVIVEFGVQRGRNPEAILRNFDFVEEYVGIDVTPDHVTAMQCQRKEVPAIAGELAAHRSQYRSIVRPRGSHELIAEDLPQGDLYIIDGDHSALGVLNDRMLAKMSGRSGGRILYHDDNGLPEVQVTQTLAMLRKSEGAIIKHVDGTWWAVEGI